MMIIKYITILLSYKTLLFFVLIPYFILHADQNTEQKSQNKIVKIGVAGPISGNMAYLGNSLDIGAQLFAEEINENTGILNTKIQIVTIDDQCSAESGKATAQKFIDQNIKFVIGHACSQSSKAALPLYIKNNILMIMPTSTDTSLTSKYNYNNIFRTNGRNDGESGYVYRYITQSYDWKNNNIAVITQTEDEYYKSLSNVIIDAFKRTKIQSFSNWELKDKNYTELINNLIYNKTKIIYFSGSVDNLSMLIQKLVDKNIYSKDMVIIGSDNFIAIDIDKKYKTLTRYNNILFSLVYNNFNKDNTRLGNLIKTNNIDKPYHNYFIFSAYSAMQVLQAGIENAKSFVVNDISKQIKDMNSINTAMGQIYYDKNGDIYDLQHGIFHFNNGRMVLKTK